MLLLGLVLNLVSPDAELTRLAQARDIEGLKGRSSEAVVKATNGFRFITQPGPYGTGSMGGWKVETVHAHGQTLAVFTTKITSEDIGEMVFALEDGKLERYLPEADTLGVAPTHHAFDIRFDPPKKQAFIVDSVQFRASSARPYFIVRMSPQYRVRKVEDQAGQTVAFGQAGGTVLLPTPPATTFTYKFTYDAIVDLRQYAGSIDSKEAMLTNDYWYPMSGRRPATYTAKITAPSGWISIAQGELITRSDNGNESVFNYRMDLPSVYFSLSSAPYKLYSKVIGERRYAVASMVMSEEEMDLQCELNAPVIEFYDKIFPYPFTTWTSVVSDAYGGGALEAYSFATYGTGWLPDEDGHEPAHTWFGGIIPNSYLRSFWNESFANYAASLYSRECPIGSREDRHKAFASGTGASSSYDTATCAGAGAFSGGIASTMGYGKGAQVLQMLENEIGVEAMKKCLRQWLIDHRQGQLGEWEDFEAATAKATGTSYKWFFDQWLRRPGFVRFSFSNWKWANGKLTGTCLFDKAAYRMNVEALVRTAQGETTLKAPLKPTADPLKWSVEFPVAKKPTQVTIDPWQRILREVPGSETRVTVSGTARQGRNLFADRIGTEWVKPLGGSRTPQANWPDDPAGWTILAHPSTTPRIAPWLDKLGVKVTETTVSFRGTTIDLRRGGFIGVIDLGAGKSCVLALGKVKRRPGTGHARAMLFDEYGRCLRAVTDPIRTGPLSYKL